MPILFDRAVVLAKIENNFGVDASPTASTDAILVGNPNISYDVSQNERNIVRQTLTKLPAQTGRKVASVEFTVEVRSNGNTDATTAPLVGRLLRGCAMAETQAANAAATIGTVTAASGNTGAITWAKTTAYAGAIPRLVTITCTTGGGTGTAEVTVSAPAVSGLAAYEETGVVITNAAAIDLPNSAQITPTIGTSLDVGDVWTVLLEPVRYEYSPISDTDSMESLTLYVYFDGLLHKVTGARGTFTIEGTAGEFANFNFTFTGNYEDPTDASMPVSPTYETQKPTMVELANLDVDSVNTFKVASFSLDMANDVVIRDSVNDVEGYAGALIVGRTPTASIDPEMELVATHDFFGKMKSGAEMQFNFHVGNTKGNVVTFRCPNVQYRSIGYAERNSIRTLDVQMALTSNGSDDEIAISFA